MKNNFFLFFLSFLTFCSPSPDLNIKIEDLKKEGIILLSSKLEVLNEDEILNLSKVSTNFPQEIEDWKYPNYNSNNLIPHIRLKKINFSNFKKINYQFKLNENNEIISVNKFFFLVDAENNLIILDDKFKILKKIKLYKKKEFPKSYSLKFSLIADNNNIYISDNLGNLKAFDIKSYKLLWKKELEVPFLSNLSIFNNSIFGINSNGKIFSFNLNTGDQNWSLETGSQFAKSADAFKLVTSDDKLIYTNDFGIITCIDLLKKSILWQIELEKRKTTSIVFIPSNLIIENNFLYLSSNYGELIKVNLSNGTILWKKDVHSFANFYLNKDTVIGVDETFFKIFNKLTGKLIYNKNLLLTPKLIKSKINDFVVNNIILINDNFYITTKRGDTFVVKSYDLDNIIYLKNYNYINSNLIIFDDKLIFFADNKKLIEIQ